MLAAFATSPGGVGLRVLPQGLQLLLVLLGAVQQMLHMFGAVLPPTGAPNQELFCYNPPESTLVR